MINLFVCEMKKFKNTYINILALLGMVSPVILFTIAYVVAKNDFVTADSYNWYSFSTHVVEAFVFLLGPLITCFLSVSSILYEYQCKTMKNILTTPYSWIQIIITKIAYTSILVIGLYMCVAITNILCALVLGFHMSTDEVIKYSGFFLLAGVSTIVLIPLTMLITLIFRNFVPAMVISVAGIIPNASAYHWDKCYLSPWAVPEVLVLTMGNYMQINIVYPIIAAISYFIIFMVAIILYFKKSDQHC